MKFPILKAFEASVGYFVAHGGTMLKILWLPSLIMIAINVVMMPGMMDAQFAMLEAEESGDPNAVFEAMGPAMRASGILYLAMAIFYPMMIAGVLRHIIHGVSPSLPFNLRYGIDELNIVLATILLFVMMMAVIIIGSIGFAIVAALVGMALSAISDSLGVIVILLGGVVLFGAFFWFYVRLSLVYAAGVGERKMGIAESWNLTSGNAFGLFVYWAIWSVIMIVLSLIFMAVFMAGYLPLMMEVFQSAQDPEAMNEINRRMYEHAAGMWDLSSPGGWFMVIASFVATMVSTALWTVPAGMAYRMLKGQ